MLKTNAKQEDDPTGCLIEQDTKEMQPYSTENTVFI